MSSSDIMSTTIIIMISTIKDSTQYDGTLAAVSCNADDDSAV